MKKLFIALLLTLTGNHFCKIYCQNNFNATSNQSSTDVNDWILQSGAHGYAGPSQIVLDGSSTAIGGSVKIISQAGSSGNGNIELQTNSNIIFRYGTTENTSVRVGIGFNTPVEALHINGNIRGNLTGGALRINTANGTIDLGPQSSTCANINTDRNYFLFNKPISSTGNLLLQTDGTTRLTVMSDGINGGLSGGALRIRTTFGTLDLGPQSSTCANINTDRNYFLFNKPISSTGNLVLQTDGTTRLTVLSDGINGGLTAGALRIRTTYGTLDLGPQSSTCANINTDMNYFLFNKPISSTGNLVLQTDGTTRLTVLPDGINGGLTGGALRIRTTYGTLDLGPQSSICANISTDMNYFLFNKPISSTGNLVLQTDGTTRLTVLSDGINGGLTGGALRIRTTYGTFDLGPQSATCANINTDRNYFLFNKPVSSTGNFSLQTDGNTRMVIESGGKVGIGSVTPIGKFQLSGQYPVYLDDNICVESTGWRTNMIGFNAVRKSNGEWETKGDGSFNGGAVIASDTQGGFHFYSFPSTGTGTTTYTDAQFVSKETFSSDYYGNVNVKNALRIGDFTNADPYRLSVDGKIIAEEIVVEMSENWPDYVFSDSYKMRSLQDLESFIKKNNRLPDVPSADEVNEKGIGLGEMNKILLEKVEELTIYLIEIKKENVLLQNRISNLEKR